MANVVTNPVADQSIVSNNLLPAASNTTQSLGSSSAPWNASLYNGVVTDSLVMPGTATIVMSGVNDPYSGLIQNAISALPSTGGTIDARAGGVASVAQGAVDPGSRVVEILLGPYTYTFTSITVRSGFRIAGVSEQSTVIKASATASGALFFGPGSTSTTASGCSFERFRIYSNTGNNSNPSPSNTLDGFQFDASQASASNNGGLWYSVFREIGVFGFGKNAWHFLGASAVGKLGFHQFITFIDCVGVANGGTNGPGGNALRCEGAMYQFFFMNCQFDGPTGNSSIDTSSGTVPAIFLGAGPGAGTAGFPYIIGFHGCTSQGREVLVQADGASDVTFRKMHHETAYGAYKITYGANGANVPTAGITITESSFNGTVGVNSGNGFILDVTTANANGIHIHNNYYAGVGAGPDNWLLSSAASTSVSSNQNYIQGATNIFAGGGNVPAIVSTTDLTVQGANISARTIFVPPVTGWYRMTSYSVVTRAASTSSTLPTVNAIWTDGDTSTVESPFPLTGSYTGNALGGNAAGNFWFYARGGSNIQFSATGYASNGATSMQFATHVILEQVR